MFSYHNFNHQNLFIILIGTLLFSSFFIYIFKKSDPFLIFVICGLIGGYVYYNLGSSTLKIGSTSDQLSKQLLFVKNENNVVGEECLSLIQNIKNVNKDPTLSRKEKISFFIQYQKELMELLENFNLIATNPINLEIIKKNLLLIKPDFVSTQRMKFPLSAF